MSFSPRRWLAILGTALMCGGLLITPCSAQSSSDGAEENQSSQSNREQSNRNNKKSNRSNSSSQKQAKSEGYDQRNDSDNWFYDYYDDGFMLPSDYDNDGLYEHWQAYYDFDGDGQYDAFITTSDLNGDGFYDWGRYYTFSNSSDSDRSNSDRSNSDRSNSDRSSNSSLNREQRRKAKQNAPKKSRQESVTGKIANVKHVSVRDTKHTVVSINKSDSNENYLADLGPAKKLNDLDLEKGDKVTVRGSVCRVGNKPLLVATKLQANGQSTSIEREAHAYHGEIANMRKEEVQGHNHVFAVLEMKDGKRRLIDLGRADRLSVNLNEGDEIDVKGTPIRANGKKIVHANCVICDGNRAFVNRAADAKSTANRQRGRDDDERARDASRQGNSKRLASQRKASQQRIRPERSVSGEVASTQTVNVNGRKRLVATIEHKDDDDQRMAIDLGPAGKLKAKLSQGDKLRARGIFSRTGNRGVLIARRVTVNGKQHEIARVRGQRSSERGEGNETQSKRMVRKQRTVSGEVLDTHVKNVNGKSRRFASIRTKSNDQVEIDLGEKSIDFRVDAGDQLTATGIPLKVRNRRLLVATKIESDGRSHSIRR